MRAKTDVNAEYDVERISGEMSRELADRCPDRRLVFPDAPCTNVGCEYSVRHPGYKNCSFVAAEVGEHTLEAIGGMMGITREGVRLIEVRALRKVRESLEQEKTPDNEEKTTLCEPRLPARRNNIISIGEVNQRENQSNVLPALNDRELGERFG